MKLRASITAVLCLFSAGAAAQEFDLSMSDDTALVRYATPISYSGSGHTDFDMGLMYTETDNIMVFGGIEMIGEAGSQAPGMHLGVGVKGYGISLDNGADVASVTLGGKAWYVPPKFNRLGLVAQYNFGPDITTFGDARRFSDFNARIEYEVLPEAAMYLGYRNVWTRLTSNQRRDIDVDLDEGWHIGLRMSF